MKLKNHILILTPGFPKDENDFLCTPPLQDFLLKYKELDKNTKFTVVAFQYPYKKSFYSWHNLDVYSVGGNNSKIKKIFIWKKVVSLAKAINREITVTTIHSLWFGECAFIGNYLSKLFNCNHTCTLMGQDVSSKNLYLKLIKKKNIKVISLSKNQSKDFYQLTNRKVDYEIFWGIENQDYDINKERKIDLLGVGSLIELKNYSLFLKLIAEVKKEFPYIVCKLIGDGPELLKLKSLAKSLEIEENIEFLGLLSRKEIFEFMKQSTIFIHPSKFEGSGFVFAEALANGMNIVSFNVGYAKQSDKWFIAKDDSEFIFITKKLLSSKLDFSPTNIFPIDETVNKYKTLYNQN